MYAYNAPHSSCQRDFTNCQEHLESGNLTYEKPKKHSSGSLSELRDDIPRHDQPNGFAQAKYCYPIIEQSPPKESRHETNKAFKSDGLVRPNVGSEQLKVSAT